MPQGRILLKSISESQKLPKLKTDGARLLYTWLISHLDINGCFSGDAEVIKGKIFTRLKKTTKIVEGYLKDMEDVRLIIRYEINGDMFLHSPDFVKKQPQLNPKKEGKPHIPKPPPELLQSYSEVTPEQIENNSTQSKVNISKEKLKVKERKDSIKAIIDYFNEITGQKRSYTCDVTNKLINGRFDEGKTIADFKHVIDTKTSQWIKDLKMRKYLRPSTLFLPGKFEDYLNEPYEKPRKIILQPGEADSKDKLPIPNDKWSEIAKYLFNKGKSEREVANFYGKAIKAFPEIKELWEKSDKKPETFIRLIKAKPPL